VRCADALAAAIRSYREPAAVYYHLETRARSIEAYPVWKGLLRVSAEKVVPVVLSVAVIIAVAFVQERSRYLAAVLATMPLTAPLALWIVYSSSGGDRARTAEFTASMILGVVATLAFVIGTWLGLRQGWSLPWALVTGGATWLVLVVGARFVQSSW
jgi:uncharacterized membrane protein (GlpM family)